MRLIKRKIKKTVTRLFLLYLLGSAALEGTTSCTKEESFTEKWLREYAQNTNGQDDSGKSEQDHVEKTYGETTVTFSVQPGDTLYTLGGEGVLEYTVEGDPDAVGVTCKYNSTIPCKVEKTETGGIIHIDGVYMANLKDVTMPEETYTDYHHDSYNKDFTVTVYIKLKDVTDANGRVTSVDAKCNDYTFHHRIYSMKYESGFSNEEYKNVTPAAEGLWKKQNKTGVNLPAEGGSFTFDPKDFVISTWPRQAPELNTIDILSGAELSLVSKYCSGFSDWVHIQGTTVTADPNETEYGRWIAVQVILGEPFKGEKINLYNGSSVFYIYQRGSTRKVDGCVWFRDPELKHALLKRNSVTIDTDGDGEISYGEALATEEIDIEPGFYNITDQTGLEAFTNIHKFCMPDNDITDLTVLGTYRNLNHLNILGCDKLDCTIDFRACRNIFFRCSLPRETNSRFKRYSTQVMGVVPYYFFEGFESYVDRSESENLDGQDEFHLIKKGSIDSDINIVFLPVGFVQPDYRNGTAEDAFKYMMNALKDQACIAPYFEKLNFYYMKNVFKNRFDEEYLSVLERRNGFTDDHKAYQFTQDNRKNWVKTIYENFCI